MEKIVKIGGKDCRMKTSAALPRVYRLLLGRDIFQDVHTMVTTLSTTWMALQQKDVELQKDIELPSKEAQLEAVTLVENLAFTMHKHGDSSQPNSVEKWLEQFDDEAALTDSEIVMELIALWNHETETTAEEKKKKDQSTGE